MSERFIRKSGINPQLDYDLILLEGPYPVLFTCIDKENGLYICSCHCVTTRKKEWIIVQTTPQNVIELLTDKITIRDIFSSCKGKAYIATMYAGKTELEIQSVEIGEIPASILPTAGCFMEPSDSEFDKEIEMLKSRMSLKND